MTNSLMSTKLELNNLNINNSSTQNYPSSRGNKNNNTGGSHHSVVADEARAQSSHAIKTFDSTIGSRN